jgi:hypothetical protein
MALSLLSFLNAIYCDMSRASSHSRQYNCKLFYRLFVCMCFVSRMKEYKCVNMEM